MKKRFWILIFLVVYILFYPIFIWNLPVIQNSFQSGNINYGTADVNINVHDSVSFSVVHTYFGINLPVYVGDICVRFWNKLWVWSFIFLVWDIIYILSKMYYGNKIIEPISEKD